MTVGVVYATWSYVSVLCHTREPHLPALRATAPARGRAGEAKKTGVKMEREKTKKKEKGKEPEKEKIREKGKEEKEKKKEVEKEKIKEKEKEKGREEKSKNKEEKRKERETEKEKEQLKGKEEKEDNNILLAKPLLEPRVRDLCCRCPTLARPLSEFRPERRLCYVWGPDPGGNWVSFGGFLGIERDVPSFEQPFSRPFCLGPCPPSP